MAGRVEEDKGGGVVVFSLIFFEIGDEREMTGFWCMSGFNVFAKKGGLLFLGTRLGVNLRRRLLCLV